MRPARIAPLLMALALAGTARSADPEPTISVDLGGGVALDLVLVRPGTFEMGSPPDEAGRGGDEARHRVSITRPFYLGRTPVTRGQFARFAAETGHRTEAEKGTSGGFGLEGKALVQRKQFTWKSPGFPQADDHPVTIVSYHDAQAFAAWVSKKARRRFTLPTEARWEFACRAGSTTSYYDGRDDPGAIAWTLENSGDGTRPVGGKTPNAWGLSDMAGNVFEWCLDWHGPFDPEPATDPERTEPAGDKPRRVLRGGSWLREAKFARSAARYRNDPASRNADNGFRLAAEVEPDARAEAPPAARLVEIPPEALMPRPAEIPPALPAVAVESDRGWVCPALVVVAIVGVIAALRRSAARRRGPGRPSDATGVRVVPEADGFRIDAPGLPAGTEVFYSCRVDGLFREDRFVVAKGPDGLFVYTGGTPTEVEVREVRRPDPGPDLEWESPPKPPTTRPASFGPSRPPGRPAHDTHHDPYPLGQHHAPSSGWSGHPPAY